MERLDVGHGMAELADDCHLFLSGAALEDALPCEAGFKREPKFKHAVCEFLVEQALDRSTIFFREILHSALETVETVLEYRA